MGLFDRFKKKKEAMAQVAARPEAKAAALSASPKKEERAEISPPRGDRAIVPGVLLAPLVTEKGTLLESRGTYQFAVNQNTNKIEIARAILARYGVRPARVRVMNRHGKGVRFGRLLGKRSAWKRALITLPKGKTINVHEGV